MKKRAVLSGIRATGELHIGNYLGAVRHFVDLSKDPMNDCYFFVANLHTLTTHPDPADLRRYLPEIVLDYLAAGIDPEKSVIYAQSSVPETSELAVLLSNMMILSHLLRVATFKEKAKANPENVNVGLLNYPVLMAADILGPKAHVVPVGEDQLQHVEMARSLARRFNNHYGNVFILPKALERAAIRVPGLDGSGKMGKSEGNTLNLNDTPEQMWDKLKVAVTDTNRVRRSDPGEPTRCNVFSLHGFFSSEEEVEEVAAGCRGATIGCFDCKKRLHANITEHLAPYRARRAELVQQEGLVAEVLHEGGKRARKVIAETTASAREAMGIERY